MTVMVEDIQDDQSHLFRSSIPTNFNSIQDGKTFFRHSMNMALIFIAFPTGNAPLLCVPVEG